MKESTRAVLEMRIEVCKHQAEHARTKAEQYLDAVRSLTSAAEAYLSEATELAAELAESGTFRQSVVTK